MEHIQNGDGGLSVRTKLNSIFDVVDLAFQQLTQKEATANKSNTIDESSTILYPSHKAVADYVLAKLVAYQDKDQKSNVIDESSTTLYPSHKAVADYVTAKLVAYQGQDQKSNVIEENSTILYPSHKAVADYVLAKLVAYQGQDQKSNVIEENSTILYPSHKAVADYVLSKLQNYATTVMLNEYSEGSNYPDIEVIESTVTSYSGLNALFTRIGSIFMVSGSVSVNGTGHIFLSLPVGNTGTKVSGFWIGGSKQGTIESYGKIEINVAAINERVFFTVYGQL